MTDTPQHPQPPQPRKPRPKSAPVQSLNTADPANPRTGREPPERGLHNPATMSKEVTNAAKPPAAGPQAGPQASPQAATKPAGNGTAAPRKARPEEILREAAAHLKKERPAMSLRAVAARMEISPSYWSKILRGEKPLPETLLPKVVKTLGLDPQQLARLQRSILETIEEERLAPVTGLRVALEESSPIETYASLGREDFWILREWYYIPLLNLFTLTAPPRSAQEVADALEIRLDQAESAIRKLTLTGFLTETDGRIERTQMQVRFPTDRSHGDVRDYHRAMLQRAHRELSRDDTAKDFEKRLIAAVCFAGNSEKVREARRIIEEAMYRAANLMADEPVSDEVYQLNLQLMPLTTKHRSK